MSEPANPMELGQYWDVLMRRKWWFVGPFCAVLGIAVALAFLLPPVYRSEATILIERQSIPSDVVATTVRGYVQEQIEQIKQKITTWQNLWDIAEEFDLYPDQRKGDPDGVVRQVGKDIEVEMVDVKASNPEEGGERVATIAFTLAFNADTPEKAQGVTAKLADWYMRAHKEAREERAGEVSTFLEAEADRLRTQIEALEKQLATFKQAEMTQLPELMDMNLRLYEKTEQDIATAKEEIRALDERIEAMQAELSLTEPYKEVVDDEGKRMLTGSARLSMLTVEFLRASGRYSAEHPDVIRLAREIRALARQTGSGARTDELMQELTRLQDQLRQARQKYSDDHPEVIKLERAVAAVEKGFQSSLMINSDRAGGPRLPPDNPRYVTLKTQIDSSIANAKISRQNLLALQAKLDDYEKRLFKTPVVERDYKALSRDYDNAQQKYSELKNKQIEARLAQQLESGGNAEQFVLMGEAHLPTLPDSPNRIGIILLGGLFAFAAGLASAAVAESQDKTIRTASTIAEIMGVPPLAIIPRMRTVSVSVRGIR